MRFKIGNILLWILLFSLSAVGQKTERVTFNLSKTLQIVADVQATPDSIRHGSYQIIYQNRTIIKGHTQNGLLDGEWTVFYPNGQRKMQGKYVNNLPHGQWLYWGEKGDVRAKFQFNNGKKIGHWIGYYDTHSKVMDIVYKANGLPQQSIHYFRDDIIAANLEYSYSNKKTTEKRSFYYQNYNIFHFDTRVNNKLHGAYITYHTNGVIWEQFNYNHGKLMQVNKMHSEGGVPRINNGFVNGNGEIKRYYYTGNLYSKTKYTDGLKNDSITIYDAGTSFSGVGFFKNDIPTGEWKIYSKFHNLRTIVLFENDPNYTEVTNINPAAPKERDITHYKSGLFHGSDEGFDAYGEILFSHNYQYGFLHGKQTDYEGSKIRTETTYAYGNKKGKEILYNSFGTILNVETFECETTIDTNWYKPPIEGLIPIFEVAPINNGPLIRFYENLPGMDLLQLTLSRKDLQESLFMIQRTFSYGFTPILEPSYFPGGKVTEREYMKRNFTLPQTAKNKHIQGEVLVRYKVNHIGLISDIEVLKTIGFGIDEEIVNTFKKYPPFIPALYNGIPVNEWVVRKINISL